jgi:hypothetical protein
LDDETNDRAYVCHRRLAKSTWKAAPMKMKSLPSFTTGLAAFGICFQLLCATLLFAGKESKVIDEAFAKYERREATTVAASKDEAELILRQDAKRADVPFEKVLDALSFVRKEPSKMWLRILQDVKAKHSTMTIEALFGKEEAEFVRGKDYHAKLIQVLDALMKVIDAPPDRK